MKFEERNWGKLGVVAEPGWWARKQDYFCLISHHVDIFRGMNYDYMLICILGCMTHPKSLFFAKHIQRAD